ncbi:RNA polymerase factor sigma-54 [Metabacillus bambusae]|uniref:RNA polymerase factor sigma-54 n=1 Tax=Metabacillus bambusae TaxID=2795218 RepID=A0ABS3N779_9BACI|nr:RNA polymerase factor sigma-54 [Metabacillus bambusae]MBO1513926.1 RNA polymerase factor sigma-54 [Metabacillus bambusae]
MKIGLIQEQTLKLKMTQELQQAITLLQYSSADLLSYVQELIMENPLIEVKETYSSPYRKSSSKSDRKTFIENSCEEKPSLREHLRNQLVDFSMTKNDRACLDLLINALDANGYLKDNLIDLARIVNVSEELLESKLYMLQSLEPAGIGARSLQECILLQLRRLPIRNELAETIISDHFRSFAEKSWKDLAKKLNVSIIEIQEIQHEIRKLEPRPGLKFESDESTYVTPDMIVRKTNNELQIIYNDELIPQLLFNQPLEPAIQNTMDTETKDYYSKKLTQGRWLQRAIEQRKETMLNVMKVIIQKQHDYFLYGKNLLKPLTLKDIAEALDIHESTVSRTVKDKFIQTPHGLVSMKSFFSTKLDEESGEVSSASVKMKLQEMINSEDKKKPLSDQKIANELKSSYGINISRRTVTKYREQLNISTSAIRKQY